MKRILRFMPLLLILLLAGCSTNDSMVESFPAHSENGRNFGMSEEVKMGEMGITDNVIPFTEGVIKEDSSKVVISTNINIETTKFNESIDLIDELVEESTGFVQNSNIYSNGGHYGNRTHRIGQYTIRIPKEKLNLFLSSAGSIGEIVSKSSNKEDVSEHYYDTESRLNVLTTKESRILELMNKAEKMEDIITLENTLSNIIYEKEGLTGRLKGIDDKVSYSTVQMNIQEVERIEKPKTLDTTFGEEVSNAFSDSIKNLKEGTKRTIIGIIYVFPFMVILSIVVNFGVKFIMKRKGK